MVLLQTFLSFDMDVSIGWRPVKKFVCHILLTTKLSHKDTLMTLYVAIVTTERLCCYGNHRYTFMMLSVAIVTIKRPCWYVNDDIICGHSNHERSCCHGNYRGTFMASYFATLWRDPVVMAVREIPS